MSENFKNFELRFHDYCIQAAYRDLTKDPQTEPHEYYKQPQMEISALRSAMPDEALQVIRYTIDPQIPTADKNKPWIWMDKLRQHYTDTVGSSLLTDRFKYWTTMKQSTHETAQDWEVRVRQAVSLCDYQDSQDMHARDKFIFGLDCDIIRTELLKTHLKSDGSAKTMSDVASEAKALETAQKANRLISDSVNKSGEVHWTRQARLKRDRGTCYQCGDRRGPHTAYDCPAKGKICSNCGLSDHFARVCLELPSRATRGFIAPNSSQARSRGRARSTRSMYGRAGYNRDNRSQGINQEIRHLETADRSVYYTDESVSDVEDMMTTYALDTQSVHSVTSEKHSKRYFVQLPVSSTGASFTHMKFQIDTAATCNTIAQHMLKELQPEPRLTHSPYLLHPYGNSKPLKPLGEVQLLCEQQDRYETLVFQVLPDHVMGSKPALLSGGDSEHLGLVTIKSHEVYSISSKITCVNDPNSSIDTPAYQCTEQNMHECLTRQAILTKYADTFKGIGSLGPTVHFKLKEDTHPVQMPIHRVPVTKRAKEKQAIDNYVKAGILKKVHEPTPWCSNELIRETPKKFRVCIDPSQTINKVIERPVYQMPTLPEHLHKLSKAKCFSLADVREGFLHLPLDDESSYLTTMHTSYGRYRWTRLPFGISSAPEEFQMRLNTALEGLDGTFCIADDILVYGEGDTYEEAEKNHDQRFIAFMDRCHQKTIKLNPDKLQFKLREIKFMGNIVTDTGIRADPEKVMAITEMEAPTNKSALLRFIGMANYLSPYCKNLSSTIQPLRMLTHDGVPYSWSDEQQSAFVKAKALIANAPTLMYYDINKPVVLQVDASDQGLGGTLLQPNENGTFQPVAYTSCSLNSTEQMYSQIEKECLAICNCFSKFDHWLYGKSDIEVHTDNLPLVTVLKKPLNKATARLQRMLMKLQRYTFRVLHKRGTSLYLADTLSRAALPQPVSAEVTGFDVFRVDLQHTFTDKNVRLTEPTETELREETQKDRGLAALCQTIIHGWPEKSHLDDILRPYWSYRDELTMNNGIVYKGQQVMVPQSMQQSMLKKIHVNHLGAESNIRLAREVLFWPGMRTAIQDMCSACQICAQYGSAASKEPMKSLPIPVGPWQLISQDIFTLKSEQYLVTVCHFSDWIEVDKLEDLSASVVIDKTKAHFSRYGIPNICHTDNGPQFGCAEYENFAKAYCFQHTTSSPYHPEGNGRAEAAVKLIKTMMKKSDDFHAAMLHYRNTPPRGHTYSPAQRMLLRRTRTTLPTTAQALAPLPISYETVVQDMEAKRKSSKLQYDKHAQGEHAQLTVGSWAYAKPPPNRRGDPWSYGVVTNMDRHRSYTLRTPSGTIRRNRVHIRPAASPQSEFGGTAMPSPVPTLPCVPPVLPSTSVEPPPQNMPEESPTEPSQPHNPVSSMSEEDDQPVRKSTREKRPPAKLQDFVVTSQ